MIVHVKGHQTIRCPFQIPIVISRLVQSWYIRGKMSVFLYFEMLESVIFIGIIKNQI